MTSPSFTPIERASLAAFADVLIPAGGGFPSASEAGVGGNLLDQLLTARPDLEDGLRRLAKLAQGQEASSVVAELKANDPALFGILAEFAPGAYFLNEAVRAKLRYHGQIPRPIDPEADYLEDGLLQSVIDRGPIYRRTHG